MYKYWQVFKISFQQEFAYRANFIMWRVRNIIQIFLVFFLWDSVFANQQRVVFGYDRAKILTYVFGLLIVRAFVLSARTIDVGGEIARGELSNYLVKPISYIKYWLTRDLSSKALNIGFAVVETGILYFFLRPPFFLQTNLAILFAFIISIALAMLIYFLLLFISGTVPFWYPEATWGAQFLLTSIFVEFLSGALFPLDILPSNAQKLLDFTPFPYLIFFPLQIYLGKIEQTYVIKGILVSGVWAVLLWFLLNKIWQRGLKVYQSYGR